MSSNLLFLFETGDITIQTASLKRISVSGLVVAILVLGTLIYVMQQILNRTGPRLNLWLLYFDLNFHLGEQKIEWMCVCVHAHVCACTYTCLETTFEVFPAL